MGEFKDKLEGKARELKGKVTDDRSEELRGKAQQAWGAVQGKVDDLKDKNSKRNRETPDSVDTVDHTGEGAYVSADRDTVR